MKNANHSPAYYTANTLLALRTNMVRKSSHQEKSNRTAEQTATVAEKLEPELRQRIIKAYSEIKGERFAAIYYRHLAADNHLYSDAEMIQSVKDIQSQIADNEEVMKEILGVQFGFFKEVFS